MQTIIDQIPASGALPENYQEVLSWRVTGKPMRVIALNIFGVILFIIFGMIFSSMAIRLGKMPSEGNFRLGLGEMGLAIVGIVVTLVLHELTHGLVMQMFGASPKYGIIWKGLMLYATSPGYAYRRNNYVVIALAPFVFISVLVILGMWILQGTAWVVLLAVCGVVNASGAVGDMWITMIVLRYAATAYVMDERDGIRMFSLAPSARTGVPKP
jgi:hypothetical protein